MNEDANTLAARAEAFLEACEGYDYSRLVQSHNDAPGIVRDLLAEIERHQSALRQAEWNLAEAQALVLNHEGAIERLTKGMLRPAFTLEEVAEAVASFISTQSCVNDDDPCNLMACWASPKGFHNITYTNKPIIAADILARLQARFGKDSKP